jgi:hypothetical protein
MNKKPEKPQHNKPAYPLIKWLSAVVVLFFLVEVVWVRVSLHGWLYLCIGVVVFNLVKVGINRTSYHQRV